MRYIFGIMVVVVCVLLVGCGNVEPAEESVAPAIENSVAVTPTGVVHQVVIENMRFAPTDLEVKVGDTIEWVNKDGVAHTVSFENGDVDAELPPGGTATHVIPEQGQSRYFCRFHPGMQASVIAS